MLASALVSHYTGVWRAGGVWPGADAERVVHHVPLPHALRHCWRGRRTVHDAAAFLSSQWPAP